MTCYSSAMNHLKELNQAQKEAVMVTDGPLLIVAGAGAGKTKTITHRMIQQVCQGVPADRILAVTFTNKAAGEMRERTFTLLSSTPVQHPLRLPLITTFHSLSVRLLRELGRNVEVERSFVIWDRDDSMRAIKKALKELDIDEEPRKVLAVISHEKGVGMNRDGFVAKSPSFFGKTVAAVWERYETTLRAENALDFDDLLVKCFELLQHADIREKLQQRWTHITIDEYQDTNAVQYEIARLLAGHTPNICAVGDVDQVLYSWRGARVENLLMFEKSFPGTKVVMLEQNYRSTKTILAAANGVIEKNVNRHPKRLYTENETGDAIVLAGHFDEQAEARYVVQTARTLLEEDTPASEIAILYRENFQSRALEEQCIRQGVPYRVLGTRFFERAEVKDVLAYLRAALNSKSRLDVTRAAGAPPRGIGKTTLEAWFSKGEEGLSGAARIKVSQFRALLDSIRAKIQEKKPSEAIHFVIIASDMEKKLKDGEEEDRERLQNIRELVSLAVKYDSLEPREGIEHLLEDAALMSEQDSLQEKKEAVSLMTVHASKGLEFDAIFITGLEQGLFPSERFDGHSTTLGASRDPEEERRLFYVALTRARKYAYLTYASSRLKYGTREYTTPSEFIDDIDPRLIEVHAPQFVSQKPGGRGILDMYEDDEIR